MNFVKQYRSSLIGDIDFTKTQNHTFAELLYISFMEPNAERLSREWNVNREDVKQKMKMYPLHVNKEFPFLDSCYSRSDVDLMAPFGSVRVPESAREYSAYEPDFIK